MKSEQFVKIDSHCHLTSDELINDVEGIITRAKEAGVKKIININTDRKTFERGLVLKQKYPDFIENTAATTPHDVKELGHIDFSIFEEAAKTKQLIAIGETGLDYHYEHSDRQLQKEFLHRYIKLAKETNLPLIFHCRGDEAFHDLFEIAKQYLPFSAILHCFTGNNLQAKQCVENGWYISMSGIVTFKKSHELRSVLKTVPLERIVIETDAPYLAPQTKRGKRNESAYIHEVLQAVASVHSQHLESASNALVINTLRAFNLDKAEV